MNLTDAVERLRPIIDLAERHPHCTSICPSLNANHVAALRVVLAHCDANPVPPANTVKTEPHDKYAGQPPWAAGNWQLAARMNLEELATLLHYLDLIRDGELPSRELLQDCAVALYQAHDQLLEIEHLNAQLSIAARMMCQLSAEAANNAEAARITVYECQPSLN